MMQLGFRITQTGDPLTRISLQACHERIITGAQGLRGKTEQLRLIREIDQDAYRKQKVELPYITSGIFQPPIRKKENFAAARIMLFDFDHFPQRDAMELSLEKLKTYPSSGLLFRSPSGAGIKMLVMLTDACSDSGLFVQSYKSILRCIAEQYDLIQHADFRTHDVTRACFLCYDKEAWINPFPLGQILPSHDESLEQTTGEKLTANPAKHESGEEVIGAGVLLEIKKKLQLSKKAKPAREVYVPVELETRFPAIETAINRFGIAIRESRRIHYGRQLTVEAGPHWAEVNLFYGKRGFSVVKTMKSGSHPELADMVQQIVKEALETLWPAPEKPF
jgi:hypothetical protein